MPDFRHGEGQQIGRTDRRAPRPPMAAARAMVRKANANMASVTWRCHAVQVRTSYWSKPTSPLAASKHDSTVQRAPATRTSIANGVPSGAKVTQPQPHRDGLRQAQDFAPPSPGTDHRWPLAAHRTTDRPLQLRRMRQLLPSRCLRGLILKMLWVRWRGHVHRKISMISIGRNDGEPPLYLAVDGIVFLDPFVKQFSCR